MKNKHTHKQLRVISSNNTPSLDVPSVGCHGKSGPPVVSSLSVPPFPLCSTTLYYSSRHVPHLYHSVTPYVGNRFCLSPSSFLPSFLSLSIPPPRFLHATVVPPTGSRQAHSAEHADLQCIMAEDGAATKHVVPTAAHGHVKGDPNVIRS